MISLGAIFPFITVLTNPEQVYEIPFLGEILISNGMEKGDELIIPLATDICPCCFDCGINETISTQSKCLNFKCYRC